MDNKKLLMQLEKVTKILYEGNTTQGIAGMNEILPAMSDYASKLSGEEQADFIENVLNPALSAMQEKDGLMLADILTYELMEKLQ